jgi:hypothetical protein
MMVGLLLLEQSLKKPIILTLEEYGLLIQFLKQAPLMGAPRMLMLLGTIKSGKRTVLNEVIEPLVLALREDDPGMSRRPPPVFFKFEFDVRCEAEAAARSLVEALMRFARDYGIKVTPAIGSELNAMADIAGDVAAAFGRRGHELWMLIDEAQGPIVGSNVRDADEFMMKFKKVCMVVRNSKMK